MIRRAGVYLSDKVVCLTYHPPNHAWASPYWASQLGEPVLSGQPLSVEGVFQMAYIVPERLLTLVRPAFDLVLRRIRSLKRCVEA